MTFTVWKFSLVIHNLPNISSEIEPEEFTGFTDIEFTAHCQLANDWTCLVEQQRKHSPLSGSFIGRVLIYLRSGIQLPE